MIANSKDEAKGDPSDNLEPGMLIAAGKFELAELTSFMQSPPVAGRLTWEEAPMLPRPNNVDEFKLVPFVAGQVRAWSEYYRSSFLVSEAAGHGAYGEVWRGFLIDGPSRTRVVLKRFFSHKGLRVISSSMREVYFGSMLGQDRPHISRLISHFVEDKDLWLVFHDEGISLYQALFHPVFAAGMSIMYRSAFWEHLRNDPLIHLTIIHQVLLGLSDLHALNITHRDIKLENIFIDPANLNLRIGDLGSAARGSDESHFLTSLFPPTGPTINEETARYAPPERLSESLGKEESLHIDPSYDIWCVGILWLEMILGTVDLGLDERTGICVREATCENLIDRIKSRDPLHIGIEDERVLHLLRKFVSVDPTARPTAKQALNDPLFDDLKSVDNSRFMDSLSNVRPEVTSAEFSVSGDSSIAIGARSVMEDQVVLFSRDGIYLACVLDGHNGGKISEFLAEKLQAFMREQDKPNLSLRKIVQGLLSEYSKSADAFGPLEGSTLCCVLVNHRSGEVEVANVGDSRLIVVESIEESDWKPSPGGRVKYGADSSKSGSVVEIASGHVLVSPDGYEGRRTVARNVSPEGEAVRFQQITSDHKPDVVGELFYIESHGGFVSGNPPRVNGILAISRSIGVQELSKVVRNRPDFSTLKLSHKTIRLVLATDGIWDVLKNQEVAEVSSKGAQAVVDKAVQQGARDNMAVVVLSLTAKNVVDRMNEEL